MDDQAGRRDWACVPRSRRRRPARLFLALTFIAVGCQGWGARSERSSGGTESSGPRAPFDLARTDVCQRVPGKAVAQALGGQRADTLAFGASADQPSRCRYAIAAGESAHSTRQIYVVMLMSPEQFEKRHMQQQNPVTPIPGLGDAAYVTYAPAGERMDLYVLKRGVATIVVTGENRTALIKIAKVAVAQL
jgi:hypothetical protein